MDCGSGAHNGQGAHEKGAPNAQNPGVSESEGDLIRQEIAEKIKDASATRGSIPAGMEMWADSVLKKPQVRWQDVLRKLVRQSVNQRAGDEVRTFRRLGRASAATGYTLAYPSTHTPYHRIGVVLDTSGSMGRGRGSILEEAFAEVQGICDQLGAEVVFVSVDAKAGEVQEITNFKQAKLQGGGGTDMRKGITALEKMRNPVNLCVVLTDGFTPWPTKRPRRLKVVAGLVGRAQGVSVPSFIKTVNVGEKK